MNQREKGWGIDLEGRKMWYEPWPVDSKGFYREPSDTEIAEVYGISGEAIKETLLYFEECNGDVDKLINELNKHVVGEVFFTSKKSLLDGTRWYTNEYYFYFVMFTKKIKNDYNWRYSHHNETKLSKFHKIYEIGHLNFLPFGGLENDVTNSVIKALFEYGDGICIDTSDMFNWIESLAEVKTNLSYKEVVYPVDDCWLCSEFVNIVYELFKILYNNNSMFNLIEKSFEYYELKNLSFVPESLLLRILELVLNRTTNVYDVQIERIDQGKAKFFVNRSKDYNFKKLHEYVESVNITTNDIIPSAYIKIIMKLFALETKPEIIEKNNFNETSYNFTIQWQRNLALYPIFKILVFNGVAIGIFFLLRLYSIRLPLLIFVFLLVLGNFVLILLRKISIEKSNNFVLEGHLIELTSDNENRIRKLEAVSQELVEEKISLEQKVEERTIQLATANEQLKELDKVKTNFFANVSHELRTPLTLILSPLESVIKGEYSRKIDNLFFQTLLNNGERLLRLINNLLDFSRIEQGRMEIKCSKENIPYLIEMYISNIRSGAESVGIKIAYKNNMEKSEAIIDRELFEKAIYNLFSNAIKFTPSGGTIAITLNDNSDVFKIAVVDTGIGIPKEYHEVVFDRFSQVDTTATRKYEGTGIGLSLVKEIMDMHKGSVELESGRGKGARFTLTFPFFQEISRETKQYNNSFLHESQWKNIAKGKEYSKLLPIKESDFLNDKTLPLALVIEDNPDMLDFLIEIIGNKYDVISAKNGLDALSVLEGIEQIPDIIISDIMMPEMDGFELIEKLRSMDEFEGIPIILLTAKADVTSRIEGLEKGAIDYITKPFNAGELHARIKAQLEMKVLRDRLKKSNEKLYLQLKEALSAKEKKLDFSVTESSEKKVEAVIKFIEMNFDADINREDLANTVEMSSDYLSRVFNKLTGKKIMDFIYEKRVEKAKFLLIKTDKPITFIAFEVGFESIRTFNRIFKKIVTISPVQYRQDSCKNQG